MSLASWGIPKRKLVDNSVLNKVLRRCCQYITVVNFSRKSFPTFKRIFFPELNAATVILVCGTCPNITSLNIADLAVAWDNRYVNRMMRYIFLSACERRLLCDEQDQRNCEKAFCLCKMEKSNRFPAEMMQREEHIFLESLMKCCLNLKEFGVKMYFFDETPLWIELLKTSTSVKKLNLVDFPGSFFRFLSFDTIEELILEGNDEIFPAHLSQVSYTFLYLCILYFIRVAIFL